MNYLSPGQTKYNTVEASPLTKKQKAYLEKRLITWRQMLLVQVSGTVSHIQMNSVEVGDVTDRASLEEELSFQFHACSRKHKLVKKIDYILERLHEEDFGYCDSCGLEIGFKRLEIRPIATECVDCKTISEIQEQHWGH